MLENSTAKDDAFNFGARMRWESTGGGNFNVTGESIGEVFGDMSWTAVTVFSGGKRRNGWTRSGISRGTAC